MVRVGCGVGVGVVVGVGFGLIIWLPSPAMIVEFSA